MPRCHDVCHHMKSNCDEFDVVINSFKKGVWLASWDTSHQGVAAMFSSVFNNQRNSALLTHSATHADTGQ